VRSRVGDAPIRVGVDSPVETDGGRLADQIAATLHDCAGPVARVRAGDFLRARSLRLEFGLAEADIFRSGWYDSAALRREVLDPLAPGGSRSWLQQLRDPQTDRSVRQARQPAPAGLVLVLDGRFLAAPELRSGFDLLVLLDVSPAARARRLQAGDAARVLPAWSSYLDDVRPHLLADLVVRYDHPDRPALLTRRVS
jgi:hypothetical protein